MMRSGPKVKTTSSDVISLPSWNLTPLRKVSCSVRSSIAVPLRRQHRLQLHVVQVIRANQVVIDVVLDTKGDVGDDQEGIEQVRIILDRHDDIGPGGYGLARERSGQPAIPRVPRPAKADRRDNENDLIYLSFLTSCSLAVKRPTSTM